MKKNYPLAIFLSVTSTILPIAGITNAIYQWNKWNSFAETETVAFSGQSTAGREAVVIASVIFAVIACLQWLFFKAPLKKYLQGSLEAAEYDEFGRSKKKKFENLSRREREAMDAQKSMQMESLLSTSSFKKIEKEGSVNPDKDLDELVGLEPVKQRIREMAARMKFEKKQSSSKKDAVSLGSMSGRHFVFYGSPGTGKTTVAKILTGFLYQYGYISDNRVLEIDGNFLKAGVDSATKTKLVCQRAFGGVLFIDEAYSIIDGIGGFGDEVISTLIKEMEDDRDRFIVILAGYRGDMKRLLDSNEGFKSRIKEYLEFPDYTVPEMLEMFRRMAKSHGFSVSDAARNKLEVRLEREKTTLSFGNGRTVRNVLDESIDQHALNYGCGKLSESEKYVITDRDINVLTNDKIL